MAKLTLNDIVNTYSTTLINDNFTKIEDEFQDKVLYRDNPNGEPNEMLTSLDMNNRRILNLPTPQSPGEPARLADISGLADITEAVLAAQAAAADALASEQNAEISASQAASAATSAFASSQSAQTFAEGLIGTSTTPLDIEAGSKILSTQANKQFNPGQFVTISSVSDPLDYMSGQVISYAGSVLNVEVSAFAGSGNFSAWNISVSGTAGATGSQGPEGPDGPEGPQGDAATVAVGTTTTGAPGTNASVANSGTSSAAVFDFTIPRGDVGPAGPTGPAGPNVEVKDEGVSLTTTTTYIDFVGAGVVASNTGSAVTVTIPGGAGTPFAGTPSAPTTSGSPGVSTDYARGDHAHPSDAPLASNANPLAHGTAAQGVSARYSRQDHVHPSDAPVAATATPVVEGTGSVGVSIKYAREDHVHPTNLNATVSIGGNAASESLKVLNVASAVNRLEVSGSTTTNPVLITANGTDTNITVKYSTAGTGAHDFFTGGNRQFNVANTASAVNYAKVTGGATTVAPVLSVDGETNVPFTITTKGTGKLSLRTAGSAGLDVLNTGAIQHAVNANTVITPAGNPSMRSFATGSLPSASTEGAGTIVRDSTTDQLKMSNGTSWLAVGPGAGGSGGLTLLANIAATAVASIDFLSTFTSSYDNYIIFGDGLRPASNLADLRARFASSGSADTSASYFHLENAGTTTTTAQDHMRVSNSGVLNNGADLNFVMHVMNANLTTGHKTATSTVTVGRQTDPGLYFDTRNNGWVTSAVATGIQFYWTSGNFSARGRIRVYGYNNT